MHESISNSICLVDLTKMISLVYDGVVVWRRFYLVLCLT